MVLLFTYGLLMYGFKLHKVISHCRFVGRGRVRGYVIYNLGGYPGAVIGESRDVVFGEVYDVDVETLRVVDEIEGVDEGVYKRVKVRVEYGLESSLSSDAYMYVYTADTGDELAKRFKVIPGGDYASYTGRTGIINYFAYGSNVSRRRLDERGVKPIGSVRAYLEGYRRVYNKKGREGTYANLTRDQKGRVCGLLYTITLKDLFRLDAYEGYPAEYNRVTVMVKDDAGRAYYAETYIANPSRVVSEGTPPDWYMEYIRSGLKEAGCMDE